MTIVLPWIIIALIIRGGTVSVEIVARFILQRGVKVEAAFVDEKLDELARIMVRGFAEGLPRLRAMGGESWRRGYEGFVLRPSWTSVLRTRFAPGDHQEKD